MNSEKKEKVFYKKKVYDGEKSRYRLSDDGQTEDLTCEEQMLRSVSEMELSITILNWMRRMLNYAKFSLLYKTEYTLHAGEIYEIDFGIGVNCEIKERHYGVILVDSYENNQIAIVCPLKTKHHDANPTSDVAIGKIPDLLTDKETIAVFNQIRGIDKIRIYRFGIINGKKSEREGPISKLNDEQMKKIRSAIYQTIIDGNPFAQ